MRADPLPAEADPDGSLFRVLAERSPLGIFRIGATGAVEYANPRWVEMAGCDYHDMQAIRRAVHPDDQPEMERRWRDCFREARELVAEFRYVHADGTVVECATRASPVHDAAGRFAGFVGTLENVTERRRAEQAQQRALQQGYEIQRLRELDTFRNRFLNTAAHELRTPLSPLRLQLYLLRTRRAQSYGPEEKASLDILERNLRRLSLLVEDLLEAARLQAGRLGVDLQGEDLHGVTDRALAALAPVAQARRIRIERATVGDGRAWLDPQRIAQVVDNLVRNAIKFSPPGSQVLVQTEGLPDEVRLRVTDHGLGIRHDDLNKLFQPFSQVHDPNEVSEPGSGLGLYISRSIVELHQGRISVASPGPGLGTTLTVELPRAAPPGPKRVTAALQ
ncbi:MAG TPA: PAS domain-containing sensor histidine kinase [Candidatus Thermoplasmatota archaeon]|nr:PAS domain-containing sensor histidine kinase [Candidatus Thermoplasmatota archaeon]